MRLLPTGCLIALLLSAPAHAGQGVSLSSDQCGVTTPYDVRVDRTGLALTRDAGSPRVVFIHDGALRVDGKDQAVSAADAQRLRRIEQQTLALMPQAAAVAGESVAIAFDAIATTLHIMTGSDRKARGIERLREDAVAHVEQTLGQGIWNQAQFGRQFEADVERAAEDMASAMAGGVVRAMFTGGAEMERRADAVEDALEQRMEARSQALEARVDAMCAQIDALDTLQAALDYRFNGRPLQLMHT